MISRLATTAIGALVLSTGSAFAEDTIKIGNTTAYSGPVSAYGLIMKTAEAYFNKVNAEGGINGRKIEIVTYDDAYSPPKTVEQTRRLVESDEVAFIFQALGTPTNTAVHKYINAKKIPSIFNASGASKWGDPENFPWTMGWQPPYATEGEIYARHILETKPDAKIAVLYQNDDYGKDYYDGFKKGLGDKAGSMIVAEQTYESADPTIESQIINLKASGADVFFNVTTAKFSAQAIKKMHEIGWKPVHYLNNVSTSVGAVMKPAGLEASTGVISAGYLKEAGDPQWADDEGMNQWRAFMDEWFPDGDRNSTFTTYGYAVAMTLEQALRQCGDDFSRENVMKQAANIKELQLPVLLPGILIDTSPTDFFPIEAEQLMRFNGESWERFGEIISAESD